MRSQTHGSSRKPRVRKGKPVQRRGTVSIIDELLLQPHPITLNGEVQRVPTVEAIILQLLEKAIAGNGRAWQVLMKYQDFARRRARMKLSVQFVESDYTRAFAKAAGTDV